MKIHDEQADNLDLPAGEHPLDSLADLLLDLADSTEPAEAES